MMACLLKFDYKKATQAINYFALKCGGKIDEMKALKLIFFADRYHLRKYVRPITNDEYFAMKRGPVASSVKDIVEFSNFLGEEERLYASKYIRKTGMYEVESIEPVADIVFSDSDLEALEYSYAHFGSEGPFDISDITHKYPEWKKHENSLSTCSRIQMSYLDFFEDPVPPNDLCYTLSEKERHNKIEEFNELIEIETLWR
jgi:uncharacterized phage-associated protein